MLCALLGGCPLHAAALGKRPNFVSPKLSGWSILWKRAWTILPPAVLYGGAITSHSRVSSVMRRRAYATCSSENLDRFIWSHSFVVDHRSAGDPKQRKSPSTAVLDTVRPGWGNARLLSRL